MPSAKVLESKQAVVAALTERLKNACAGVIVDYKGINVADDTALRKELREAGVEYTVVKNTLLRLAIAATELNGLETVLDGTTAIATSADDYVAAARILSKFADAHKEFNIKNGFLDQEVIDTAKIAGLAKLPSREVLLAQVLGAFQAPISAFARAIQAIVDKGGEEAAAPAEEEAAAPAEPEAPATEEAAAPAEAEAPAAEEAAE
ncbi:MAG: 50S ribosomal protein L10 [Clostridia bacterium]|nr:50S ribosomal protein L10 [Clostridia bacterium]MBQ6092544.1 50S ribosomal protein L10 [Clostridia bacterium]MBR3095787.1 50S ribosomal protein L10 [Clostridia bacterium]